MLLFFCFSRTVTAICSSPPLCLERCSCWTADCSEHFTCTSKWDGPSASFNGHHHWGKCCYGRSPGSWAILGLWWTLWTSSKEWCLAWEANNYQPNYKVSKISCRIRMLLYSGQGSTSCIAFSCCCSSGWATLSVFVMHGTWLLLIKWACSCFL